MADVKAKRGTKLRILRLCIVLFTAVFDLIMHGILDDSHVNYASHLGGLFAGFIVGMIVMVNQKSEPWEERCVAVCKAIVVFFLFFSILWHIYGNDVWMAVKGRNYFAPEDYRVVTGHEGYCNYTRKWNTD